MNREEQVKTLDGIIKKGIELFKIKLFEKVVSPKPEVPLEKKSLYSELADILTSIGKIYEYSSEYHFEVMMYDNLSINEKVRTTFKNEVRVDFAIVYTMGDSGVTAVLDFKFFRKEHGQESVNRYTAYRNLYYLEKYRELGVDLCYLLLLTDDPHYVNEKAYSKEAEDFDMRNGHIYKGGTVLKFKREQPWGPDFSLKQDYRFDWKKLDDYYVTNLWC